MMRLEWSIFRRRSLPAPSFRAGRTITVVTVSVISLKAALMVPFIAVVAIVVIFVEAASMAPFVVMAVIVVFFKAASMAPFVVMAVIVVFLKAVRMASFVVMAAAVPGAVSHFAKAPGGSSFRPALALHGLVDNRAVGMFCIEQCDAVVPACPG